MAFLRLFPFLGVWCFAACMSLKFRDEPTKQSEAQIRSQLLGRWYQEELLYYGEPRHVNPVDFEYLSDETFIYRVSDGHGGTATGTVTINLTNTPPKANDGSASTSAGTPVTVYPMYMDPDGDMVTLTGYTQGSHGFRGRVPIYTHPTG